jgi:hypothetical protein
MRAVSLCDKADRENSGSQKSEGKHSFHELS